ncbi:uncharacterized protein PADG_07581 [Paracoccidioides brasiliensis Pb18]|uniref:Uncharacterized protein n=1 Tax=Paracoccidioides brasiliensis (strain Pb18) TaxID=502780 RepID=C1GJZ5_PARBD|nr:uncharacterized protein PADG_07581 [Paracoccidioides brasiliensis Pb18]EEH42761.2 hypothetical protein PADG_07581 [Paracoccidioides brasiliensis Pb18]ODH46140.1 hypothetical protein GX48_07775 [Paracoccidioides brasiliensis]
MPQEDGGFCQDSRNNCRRTSEVYGQAGQAQTAAGFEQIASNILEFRMIAEGMKDTDTLSLGKHIQICVALRDQSRNIAAKHPRIDAVTVKAQQFRSNQEYRSFWTHRQSGKASTAVLHVA